MEISRILFFVFAAMVVVPVIYMLFTRNIIRAAFAVVITLLGVAALYVLLHAEYMAVVQILIYAGGVIVLLIFGVMLTKRIGDEGVFTEHRGVFPGIVLFLATIAVFIRLFSGMEINQAELPAAEVDQVRTIGVLFLSDYLLAFELIAFILLVALVGSAYLAKKSGNL